jgi:hypothetical protein
LYISSHGYLGGYMSGDKMDTFSGATPKEAVPGFRPKRSYMVIGAAEKAAKKFKGPKWIILGQCSTVNHATWLLWAKVFARSTPAVRGILAYGEAAPDAEQSRKLTLYFFKLLREGRSFLEAWALANVDNRWSAVVHTDAVRDTLIDKRSFAELSRGSVADEESTTYLGFSSDKPRGEKIFDRPAPLSFKLYGFHDRDHADRSKVIWGEVTADKLDFEIAQLWPDLPYRVVVAAPNNEPLLSAKLTLVHVRPTYPRQVSFLALFKELEVTQKDVVKVAVTGAAKNVLNFTFAPGSTLSSFEFSFRSHDNEQAFTAGGAEQFHSYFWFRVELSVGSSGRTLRHDFTTQGLSYT